MPNGTALYSNLPHKWLSQTLNPTANKSYSAVYCLALTGHQDVVLADQSSRLNLILSCLRFISQSSASAVTVLGLELKL